jgi:anti-anti-sigma factor
MLDIHKREVGTVSVLSLDGELDLDGAQNLKVCLTCLFQEATKKVIIDWTDVDRINFASLQMVTRPMKDLLANGPMAFCGMSDAVKKSLKTVPFFDKIKEFDSEDRALTRL